MLLEQMSRMDDEARSESCSAAGLLKATTRTQKSVLSPWAGLGMLCNFFLTNHLGRTAFLGVCLPLCSSVCLSWGKFFITLTCVLLWSVLLISPGCISLSPSLCICRVLVSPAVSCSLLCCGLPGLFPSAFFCVFLCVLSVCVPACSVFPEVKVQVSYLFLCLLDLSLESHLKLWSSYCYKRHCCL